MSDQQLRAGVAAILDAHMVPDLVHDDMFTLSESRESLEHSLFRLFKAFQ